MREAQGFLTRIQKVMQLPPDMARYIQEPSQVSRTQSLVSLTRNKGKQKPLVTTDQRSHSVLLNRPPVQPNSVKQTNNLNRKLRNNE